MEFRLTPKLRLVGLLGVVAFPLFAYLDYLDVRTTAGPDALRAMAIPIAGFSAMTLASLVMLLIGSVRVTLLEDRVVQSWPGWSRELRFAQVARTTSTTRHLVLHGAQGERLRLSRDLVDFPRLRSAVVDRLPDDARSSLLGRTLAVRGKGVLGRVTMAVVVSAVPILLGWSWVHEYEGSPGLAILGGLLFNLCNISLVVWIPREYRFERDGFVVDHGPFGLKRRALAEIHRVELRRVSIPHRGEVTQLWMQLRSGRTWALDQTETPDPLEELRDALAELWGPIVR